MVMEQKDSCEECPGALSLDFSSATLSLRSDVPQRMICGGFAVI